MSTLLTRIHDHKYMTISDVCDVCDYLEPSLEIMKNILSCFFWMGVLARAKYGLGTSPGSE